MAWHQFSLFCDAPAYAPIEAVLEEMGALAISLVDAADQPLLEPKPNEMPLWNQMQINALFALEDDREALEQQLKTALGNQIARLEYQFIADQNWERAWMDDYHAMCFGDDLWIVPSHQHNDTQIPASATRVFLDPGLAFGTGTHATTALCLTWLAQHQTWLQKPDFALTDYGCGSGILAIAALKLGASAAYITDIDPQALSASRANAQNNGVADKITALPIGEAPLKPVNLWLANILAAPLIELAPVFAQHCPRGATLLLSGILAEQAESVRAAYMADFEFTDCQLQQGWALLCATRR